MKIFKSKNFFVILLLSLASFLSFFLILSFFQPGYPSSWDGGAHFVRLKATSELFFTKGRFSGWSFYWYNGFEPFLFYPSLWFVLQTLTYFFLNNILGLSVSLLFIYKVYIVLPYVLFPWFIYLSLRLFEFSRFSALIAALASPGVSAIHGIGIDSIFYSGLYTQIFSLPFFVLSLGLFHRAISYPCPEWKNKWLVLTIIFYGIVCSTNFISALALAIASALYLFLYLLRNSKIDLLKFSRKAIFISSGAFIIASPHLVPVLYHWDLRGSVTGWGDISFFADLIRGNFLAGLSANICALIFLFLKKRNFIEEYLTYLAILFYLLAAGILKLNYSPFDDIIKQAAHSRFYPYLGILILVFSGLTVDRFRDKIFELCKLNQLKVFFTSFVSIALLTCFFLDAYYNLTDKMNVPLVDSHYYNQEKSAYLKIYKFLKSNSKKNTVIAFDDRFKNFGNPGYNQMASRLVLESDRFALTGNQIEATKSNYSWLLKTLHTRPPKELSEHLQKINVGYLFAWHEDVNKNLEGSEFFKEIYRDNIARIWAVPSKNSPYASFLSSQVDRFHFSHEKLSWKLKESYASSKINFSVSYNPYWRLYLDGKQATLEQTPEFLMKSQVPKNTKLVELVYERPIWRELLNYFSLIFLAILITKIALNRGKLLSYN